MKKRILYANANYEEITDKNGYQSSHSLKNILRVISDSDLPRLYIIIDEYDNFANQLIVSHKDHLYRALTRDDSFLKTFFKTLKEGRKTGSIANVFITGVLPITIDDLASGFNIANFITLDPEFENMLGFTQSETDRLLDEIYTDYGFDSSTRDEVNTLIRNHYNGYHFVDPTGDAVYNPTILMYFLQLDVSTKYAEMMQGFVNTLDLPELFADYWELYVSQLPEAIFAQVNENFYRTTFFELCSRYISKWFTFNVERSYPQGRSDLEFVGKFHEKFAGIRMVIEFKYFSNAELKKMKTTVKKFRLRNGDTLQIAGYAEDLRAECPEAKISQYVIYCFGNQGFKVFDLQA